VRRSRSYKGKRKVKRQKVKGKSQAETKFLINVLSSELLPFTFLLLPL
jgi:hypothetical protein